MRRLNNFQGTADIIEYVIWPRSLIGWVVAFFLMLCGLLLFSEIYNFFIDYSKIHAWRSVQGHIISMKLDKSKRKVNLNYEYKIDGTEYVGDKIGVARMRWHDVSQRKISDLEHIFNDSKPITVKYNPDNNMDSVYAFDSDDIILIAFIALPPIVLFCSFLFVLAGKLRSHW